jgi:hypothetical protein
MSSPDLSSNPSSSYSSISFSPSSSSHVLSSPPSSPGNLNSRRVKQRQKSDVGLQELKFDFSEKQKTTRPPLIRSKSYVSHPKKALSNDFEVKDKSELVKQSPKKSPRKSPRISIAGLKFLTSSHYEKLQIAFNQFQEEMGSIQDRSSISPSSSDSSENPTSISLNKIFEADFEEIYQSLKSMESSKDEEAISLERLVEYLVSLKSESESKSRFVQMIQSESKADYRQKLFEMLF